MREDVDGRDPGPALQMIGNLAKPILIGAKGDDLSVVGQVVGQLQVGLDSAIDEDQVAGGGVY